MDLPESFPIFFFFYIHSLGYPEECIKFFSFFIIFKPPFLLMFYREKGFYYLRDISVYTKLRIDIHN